MYGILQLVYLKEKTAVIWVIYDCSFCAHTLAYEEALKANFKCHSSDATHLILGDKVFLWLETC